MLPDLHTYVCVFLFCQNPHCITKKILQWAGTIVYFQHLGKWEKTNWKITEVEVKIIIKMKRHVFINLKFMLKLAKVFIKLWVILINRDTFWSLCDLNYWKFKSNAHAYQRACIPFHGNLFYMLFISSNGLEFFN